MLTWIQDVLPKKEVTFYKAMQYHNPEGQNIKFCCSEKLKFHVGLFQ